jgi:hypothetical protein
MLSLVPSLVSVKRIVATLIVLGSLLLLSGFHSAEALPTLSVTLADSTPTVGETFAANVNITGIDNLYAYQFDLLFDPTLLQASIVTEGAFLPTGGTTIFFPGTIDNVSGLIDFTAAVLTGDIPGVTGTGALASVAFQAIAPGTATFNLADGLFFDGTPDLNEIGVSLLASSVTINPVPQSPQPVPEPGTLLLLASGSLGLFSWNRWRRRGSVSHV